MFLKVTLKPFTIVVKVAKTSPSGFPMQVSLAEQPQTGKSPEKLSLLQCVDDLLPVKTAIFNENLAGVPSTDHHAGQMQPLNIAFQRLWVQRRFLRMRIEVYAETLNELIIRMIPGQRKYLPRRQPLFSAAILHKHFVLGNPRHPRVEERLHLLRLNPILYIWPHPVFDRRTKLCVAMHQR